MALKIQYNKTFSQELSKQLQVRERALPILKSKETALRIEVKKAMENLGDIRKELDFTINEFKKCAILLREFPVVVKIKDLKTETKNVAGVKVTEFIDISFEIIELYYIQQPAWVPMGIENYQKLLVIKMDLQFAVKKLQILNYHRKKTTQKVNLYEKVQIPEFKSAVLKIKRYLEDEENLQKAAQKIVKERKLQMEKAL